MTFLKVFFGKLPVDLKIRNFAEAFVYVKEAFVIEPGSFRSYGLEIAFLDPDFRPLMNFSMSSRIK